MIKRVILVAAVIISIAGFMLCPKPPKAGRIDPQKLFRNVISHRYAYSYRAVQRQNYVFFGKNITRTVTVSQGKVNAYTGRELTKAVLHNYTPLVEGEDIVAGHPVWVLRLRPHDKYRPWKQLWVDKEKFIILAQREWNSRDEIKRTMKTISISGISMIAKPSLQDNSASKSAITTKCKRFPSYLPDGYSIRTISKSPQDNLTQIDYSDGLFTISLFERFSGKDAGEQMKRNTAGDCGQGTVYFTRKKGFDLTIVADLPITEIKHIAESVR